MPSQAMAFKVARVLHENPELALEFYCMASEIVDDFDDYGAILQADEDGVYSEGTTIGRLKRARNQLVRLLESV